MYTTVNYQAAEFKDSLSSSPSNICFSPSLDYLKGGPMMGQNMFSWLINRNDHSPIIKNSHAKEVCNYMSRETRKPTMWLCAQHRLRSAWASAQSDQSLLGPHGGSLDP